MPSEIPDDRPEGRAKVVTATQRRHAAIERYEVYHRRGDGVPWFRFHGTAGPLTVPPETTRAEFDADTAGQPGQYHFVPLDRWGRQCADPPPVVLVTRRPARSILVVDDDRLILRAMSRTLEQDGTTVDAATTERDAALRLRSKSFALAIVDVALGGEDGVALARVAATPVLLMSGDVVRARKRARGAPNIRGAVAKPWQMTDLLAAVEHALGSCWREGVHDVRADMHWSDRPTDRRR